MGKGGGSGGQVCVPFEAKYGASLPGLQRDSDVASIVQRPKVNLQLATTRILPTLQQPVHPQLLP